MNKLLTLIALILFSFTSKATIITVDDENWDVTYTLSTFNNLNMNDYLVSQAWWGSSSKASQFALALGFINDGDPIAFTGPLFAYEFGDLGSDDLLSISSDSNLVLYTINSTMSAAEFSFAHAIRVNSVPEPASLGLLLLGFFGILASRKP